MKYSSKCYKTKTYANFLDLTNNKDNANNAFVILKLK